VPAPFVMIMRALPVWRRLAAAASTVPYDLTIMAGTHAGEPLPAHLALAAAVPGAEHAELPGQTHVVKGKALAPMLARWFTDTPVPA
jgi:hypothetical protein